MLHFPCFFFFVPVKRVFYILFLSSAFLSVFKPVLVCWFSKKEPPRNTWICNWRVISNTAGTRPLCVTSRELEWTESQQGKHQYFRASKPWTRDRAEPGKQRRCCGRDSISETASLCELPVVRSPGPHLAGGCEWYSEPSFV